MKLFRLIFLACVFLKLSYGSMVEEPCNSMDTFKLKTKNNVDTIHEIFYVNKKCLKCSTVALGVLGNEFELDSDFDYDFLIQHKNEAFLKCEPNDFKFNECGVYLLELNARNSCAIKTLNNGQSNSTTYLFHAFVVYLLFIILCIQVMKKSRNETRVEKLRIYSLDTFRGFSLALMIFVNYGSGGFKILQHETWHGVTIADFVFPWFIWIMGFTIPMNINSSLHNKQTKLQTFKKICTRSLKMFLLGVMLNSRFGIELANLRILGVLQRISIAYFSTSSIELILASENNFQQKLNFLKSLFHPFKYFIFMISTSFFWILLTFYFPVENCPTGYLGPGGLHENSAHFNCTGGSAAFIDSFILGKTHMYQKPTSTKIYKHSRPFDPEGLLGSLNAIVLTCLGAQAGRLLILKKKESNLILLISWFFLGSFSFLLFALITKFDLVNSIIPVNKNLFTTSYILLTGSSAYFLMLVFYFVIDVRRLWSGAPFIFLGENSILVYVGHVIFANTFPCQWLVPNDHFSQLFMDLWGSMFWTLASIYFYYKKIFLTL